MDVGGKTPGSIPIEATSIFEEGTRLPPTKLYKAGEFDEELLDSFTHNTRLPDHAEADIKALAAGTATAEEPVVFEDYADDDGLGNGPIKLRVEMWREDDEVYVSWEGSDDQVPGTVNFLLDEKMFKMFVGVFLIMALDPELTFNDGFYDLINAFTDPGTNLGSDLETELTTDDVLACLAEQ